jgi:hypothetical protein
VNEFPTNRSGNDLDVTGEQLSAQSLLRRPVRLHGIRLGHPADVLLDRESLRVVGLEVACGDDERRFLPLAAARVHDDEIAVHSALMLLEGDDLSFYRRRGRMLSAMRGRSVSHAGRHVGILRDVVLDADGAVSMLEVETTGGPAPVRIRVPLDATVAIEQAPASAA